MRDIPFSCIQFTIYEYLRKKSIEKNNGSPLTVIQTAINGSISAAFGILLWLYNQKYYINKAAFWTTPIDVAKTKLMTQRDGYYIGIWDTWHKIIKEDGVKKLFSAAHIRTFNMSMSGIIFFAAYENIRYFLEKIHLN